MASESSGKRRGRKKKVNFGRLRTSYNDFIRTQTFLWSGGLFGAFTALFIIALFTRVIFISYPDWRPHEGQLADFLDSLEKSRWDFCFLGAMPIAMAVSGWFLGDALWARHTFLRLIDTNSRQELMANLKELERLAYRLGRSYEERVIDKKLELRVR